MPPVSTLTGLIPALVEIEEAILPGAPPYPLRPLTINPPAVYNALASSTATGVDTTTNRDEVIVGVRIVIAASDAPLKLLELADHAIDVIDAALKHRDGPLGGVQARRIGVSTFAEQFNTIDVQGIELPVRVRLERLVLPT